MNESQKERLVLSFERLAIAMEGVRDEFRKAGSRYWPEPKPQREPVVSRIENEEDRAKKNLRSRRATNHGMARTRRHRRQ